MRVAVLGTGTVGRAWSARLMELGHVVVVGTRDPQATRERDPHAWPGGHLATMPRAVIGVDLVVNALNGRAALEVLPQLVEALQGRVLMDLTVPLDQSAGFPPKLFVRDTDSLGERLQRALPGVRVVKAANTVNAELQVRPPREGTIFIAGNDPEAKTVVTRLLTEVGHTDVLDLGDITGARSLEMFMPLWLRLFEGLGTSDFTIKVVRPAH